MLPRSRNCGRRALAPWAAIFAFGCVDLAPPNDSVDSAQDRNSGDGAQDKDAPEDDGPDAPSITDGPPESVEGVRLGDGEPCAADAACRSGICADGTCCVTACAGPCRSCKLPGSAGTCAALATGTVCGAASCAAGILTQEATCDGAGICRPGLATPCHPYACKDATACFASCTDSVHCVAGRSCSMGSCGPKGNGLLCAAPAECASGLCVDETCCASACTETCRACDRPGSRGVCTPVPKYEDDDSCKGLSKSCDGAGACKAELGWYCSDASACISGFCADNECCESACAGTCMTCASPGGEHNGKCVPRGRGLTDYPDCTGGFACDGMGVCKLDRGQPCAGSGAECASGFCTDGRCCVSACADVCRSCDASGFCVPVPLGGTDGACTGSMACTGTGSCRKTAAEPCAADAECASGLCEDGVCCYARCGTCARCDIPGSLGVCADVPKGSADGTCSLPSSACDGTGSCKKMNGQPCLAGECLSGFCVDSKCCENACSGACVACNKAGSEGACSPLAAGTDPAGECASTCDAGTCVFTPGTCDGAGACKAAVPCAPFGCSVAACRTTCAGNADCCGGGTLRACIAPSSTLACGASFADSTSLSLSRVSAYGACTMQAGSGAGVFSGYESHYRFFAATFECVAVTLTTKAGNDVDLFVWPEDSVCSARSGCLGSALAADTAEVVRFTAAAASSHFIVVDSKSFGSQAFTLDIACTPGPC